MKLRVERGTPVKRILLVEDDEALGQGIALSFEGRVRLLQLQPPGRSPERTAAGGVRSDPAGSGPAGWQRPCALP